MDHIPPAAPQNLGKNVPVRSLLWLQQLGVALAYAFAGWLAHHLTPDTGFASLVWLPSGLALGLVLARGRQMLIGVLLGAACINSYFQYRGGHSPGLSLVTGGLIGAGAGLQAWVGLLLVARACGLSPALDSPRSVARFLVFGATLSSTVSATVGTSVLAATVGDGAFSWLRTWLSWWLGDALGVTLIAPIALALFALPGDTSLIWRQRRLSLALPLVAAVVVQSAAYIAVGRFEMGNRQAEFERHAARQTVLLNSRLQSMLEIPVVLRDYLKISGTFERSDFEAFAGRIHARHPGVWSLVWLSVGKGNAVHGADFVFPLGNRNDLIGLDFQSDPNFCQALAKAEESRLAVVSAGFKLSDAAEGQQAMMVLVPVFWAPPGRADEVLRGFVGAIVKIADLSGQVLPELEQEGMLLRVLGLSERQATAETLFSSDGFDRASDFRYRTVLEFGTRSLQFEFVAKVDSPVLRQTSNAWPVYFGGLFFSLLLTAFLLLISASAVHAERLVSERTRELERMRQEAERANKLFHEAVGSIAQGFTVYDEQDRLIVCNEAYLALYEASRDLIVPGATFEEIVRKGAERGQYVDAIGRVDEWVADRVRQHQQADGRVIEQKLGDGRWLMIVEYRTPSGCIAGNRIDITPIKQAAAQVEDRNAQLDALFSLSPDGFVAFDRSGAVKFANPAFCRMTGIELEEIAGKSQEVLEQELLSRAERKVVPFSIEETFEAGGEVHILNLLRPEWRCLQIVGVLSQSSEIGRILYLRDVTREMEVSRMKSEFLSHAAHELRTPMTSILGFSELMLVKDFSEDRRKEILATIHRQTRWLVDIINELLDLARIEARRGKDFNLASLDLTEVITEVLAVLSFDSERWPVRYAADVPAAPVRGDVAKLRQALTNIIGNAQKYSPDGGEIGIRLRADSGRFGVEVRDHGLGMTPEQLENFGERFWRADASGKTPGTGLGISIVKEIIELHGGSMEVRSEYGSGSCITLWLPAESAEEMRKAA